MSLSLVVGLQRLCVKTEVSLSGQSGGGGCSSCRRVLLLIV
jgi:hypothetical protein